MARIKNQEVIRRNAVASRDSAAPQLSVQADLDSSRGYNALSRASLSVLGRLSDTADAVTARRASQQAEEDQTRGAAERTQETVEGAPARTPEDLANETATYRRGYFLTEAVNRLNDAKLSTAKRLATLRPGEDPQPIVEEELGNLLGLPEFQDQAVLKQLAPALQQMRSGVLEFHQKTELAEIFESQVENLREIARADILSGALLTPEGISRFRATLDSEQFAYLSEDEADGVIAEAVAGVLESGELDPAQVTEFLKTRVGERAALWDQGDNASKFETAAKAGALVRQRAFEEQQANAMAEMEPQLQDRAGRGALSTPEIFAVADKLGLDGKPRHSFVRHWIDQTQAGQRRMEAEAKAAARHREVIGAINAGAALKHTDSELQKAAKRDWAAAVGGDQAQRAAVIQRYTKAGVVIPQLKDLLGRTTTANLSENYALYQAISKIDPIAADRYLSDENATLFAQHHDNVTQFGMTPQESIRSLPTGANKGRRPEVASAISKVAAGYFKDNPEMPDGTARPWWFNNRVQRIATELALANPNASPEVNLQVAERRAMADSIKVNGQWVPRGGARTGTEPAIEEFVQRAGKDAVAAGVLTEDQAGGVRAAPHPDDPSVFVVLRPDGFPMVNPKTNRPVVFDPNEVAASRIDYEQDRAEAEARFNQERAARRAPRPLAEARAAAAPGEVPVNIGFGQASIASPDDGAKFEFPDFIDYLHDNKRKPAQGN